MHNFFLSPRKTLFLVVGCVVCGVKKIRYVWMVCVSWLIFGMGSSGMEKEETFLF